MDQKRYYRQLKKAVKKKGNKKRRQYLKDVDKNPDDFDFGKGKSSGLNGKDYKD